MRDSTDFLINLETRQCPPWGRENTLRAEQPKDDDFSDFLSARHHFSFHSQNQKCAARNKVLRSIPLLP
jgi:hypothetical protein